MQMTLFQLPLQQLGAEACRVGYVRGMRPRVSQSSYFPLSGTRMPPTQPVGGCRANCADPGSWTLGNQLGLDCLDPGRARSLRLRTLGGPYLSPLLLSLLTLKKPLQPSQVRTP